MIQFVCWRYRPAQVAVITPIGAKSVRLAVGLVIGSAFIGYIDAEHLKADIRVTELEDPTP